ncbi:molybdenum cofactor biosynthesis protein [Corynebacterium phocae]|uniref:Molybdenum cofactor biosynthesis protein n=1 Tax=Corynebacterium phocae TaxID=161895 RepID=A0A1L7D6L2_9CORY|nr:molybdenum cofactor biosynthesis protein [Corynebacterium phocae]
MREKNLSALLDIADPDDEFFRATEREGKTKASRRALAVIVTDHPEGKAESIATLVSELLHEADFRVDGCVTVKSKKTKIRQAIETAVVGGVDLVVTIGGTGVGPRDKTPDATAAIIDQMVPGIAQALRSSGQACGAVDACTSRGISGVSGSTVVVNLAESRPAIRDGMAMVPPLVHHLIDQLQRYDV